MFPFRTILHPTDFSEHSAEALRLAAAVAVGHDADLILLHVVPPPLLAYSEGSMVSDPKDMCEALRLKLEQVAVVRPDNRVQRRVVEGDPVTEILRVSDESRADLIVMGPSSKGGQGRLLLGSVADQVLRRTTCPVLIVRAPVPAAGPDVPRRAEKVVELCPP